MTMTPAQKQVVDMRGEKMSWQAIADELKISPRSVRDRYDRGMSNSKRDPAIQAAMDSFGLDTEPDLVWLKNQGYSVKVGKKPQHTENFIEKVREAFQDIPKAPSIEAPVANLIEMMVVYPLFDAHLGLRAHKDISGEEMDLKTGSRRVIEGMQKVMAGSPDAYRGIIVNGGDFTHQTDDKNQTRRGGHILDVDGRNIITVIEAIEVISTCIEMALTKHKYVEYYSVPGNHDPQNWETILIGLRERYSEHHRVKIDFNLTGFSVIEHGEVGIFIHHGDKRPPKDLCMFCSAEFPEVFGRTRFRVLMTGHLHHIKVDEFPGWYWMQLPALTVRDQYASGGYKSHSLLMGIGYDRVSEDTRKQVKL